MFIPEELFSTIAAMSSSLETLAALRATCHGIKGIVDDELDARWYRTIERILEGRDSAIRVRKNDYDASLRIGWEARFTDIDSLLMDQLPHSPGERNALVENVMHDGANSRAGGPGSQHPDDGDRVESWEAELHFLRPIQAETAREIFFTGGVLDHVHFGMIGETNQRVCVERGCGCQSQHCHCYHRFDSPLIDTVRTLLMRAVPGTLRYTMLYVSRDDYSPSNSTGHVQIYHALTFLTRFPGDDEDTLEIQLDRSIDYLWD